MSHNGWQYPDPSGRYSRDRGNPNNNSNHRGFGSNNDRRYNNNEPTPFSNNSSRSYGQNYSNNNGSRNYQPTSFGNNYYHGQTHRYDDHTYRGDGSNRGREPWRGGGGGNSDTKKRDAPPAAAYQRSEDSSKKPKSHQIYHRDDLSPEQRQYRDLVASQLQDGENVGCIPPQAFSHQEGWEERKTLAVEYCKDCVLVELKKIAPGNAYGYSDDDGSDSDYSYVGNKPTPGTLTALEIKFFDALPKCTMMMLGFDIDDKGECALLYET